MTAATDLVALSGELKRDLLAYARRPRYDRAFRDFLASQDPATLRDEHHMIMLMDHFVLQHRLGNGKTVVEQFVASRDDLGEVDRELLLGWRDVVEGIFEVQRRDGPALIVENVIDDLTYRVRSTMGPGIFRRMPRRSFVITRLVPCGTEWLISGATSVLPAAHRDRVLRVAAETAARSPELVFRNPAHLEKGWELQHAERERFIRFFGSDLVIVPGDQLTDRLRDYQHFSQQQVAAGRPTADAVNGADPPAFDLGDLPDCDTVGIIYDQVEGLNFYAEFGQVEAVFADPALLRRRLPRQRLIDYLDDDSVSPLPFRRLAERHPDTAGTVFARLLHRPGFDWNRDGEALLRERKAAFFDQPARPSISPVSDRLARYLRRP